jgi:putative N-acetyltransferase (TIGR04045 family)
MPSPPPVSPFSASAEAVDRARDTPEVGCRAVGSPTELALHLRIRTEVFVREQGFFTGTDADVWDRGPTTIHALGTCGGIVAGTVRLYPLEEDGLWKGDRLAVLPAFRSCGLAGPLVRYAVRSAGRRGGARMIAYIQPQNVPVFERLGWRPVGPLTEYVGRPHQQMEIGLVP